MKCNGLLKIGGERINSAKDIRNIIKESLYSADYNILYDKLLSNSNYK